MNVETTITVNIRPFGQLAIVVPSRPVRDIVAKERDEHGQIRYIYPEDTASGVSEFLFEEESADYVVPRMTA